MDGFYNKKYGEASRRLKLLSEKYSSDTHFRHGGNKEEIGETIAALLELRSRLRKLQWYGEVNRRGFVKILKKLDKKVPTACAQQHYLQARVDPRPFATNLELSDDVTTVNIWLSRLGDSKSFANDTASSGTSFSKNGAIAMINLRRELLDDVERAVNEDDVEALVGALSDSQEYESQQSIPSQRFLLHVLQRAITSCSKVCIADLLGRIVDLDDESDINNRNCIHRLVISVAHHIAMRSVEDDAQLLARHEASKSIVPAAAPGPQGSTLELKEVQSSTNSEFTDSSVVLLQYLLDNLTTPQRKALIACDSYGRVPLHYAAQHGFPVLCEIIIQHMQSWGQTGFGTDDLLDVDGNSPVHLSVIGGHPRTTKCLLAACSLDEKMRSYTQPPLQVVHSGSLLSLATRADYVNIVTLLVDAGANVNYVDHLGETALHVAARFGHVDCARALLAKSSPHPMDLNICERTFGWTALHVASVDGHFPMVDLLVQEGAHVDRRDNSGWTAKEHAALRGHLDITALLAKYGPIAAAFPSETQSATGSHAQSLGDRSSTGSAKDLQGSVRNAKAVKSFGHRYLKGESLVLVSLGSMDQRKSVKPVDLDNVPLANAHATQLDTALSVVVSTSGASGDSTTIDLPVQENISTEPIAFSTQDVTKVKILFDIVPTYAGSKDQVVGRGVALLSSVKPTIGSKRMNLQGDISVPIVAAKTLDIIGSVNFNFIVITPFEHPKMSIDQNHTYWKSTAPMVIGHRGMGKNMATRKSLQLGENTMQSFIAAANLGASYVEFDVQLTKDHVPVIYHDFLVSETGIDAPVHTLTLEQFLHVNETQTPRASRPASPHLSNGSSGQTKDVSSEPGRRLQRAQSLGAQIDARTTDMPERMKHTRDFKLKGYKGNSRGNFIQAPFTTLQEMLCKLPASIGFNIEMKYPMLWESEEQEMDTYAVELNSFVDTVLNMVYDHGKERDIIFSSFNPDICLLLSFKQPSIPVLFLTDAGTCPVGDIRASSLQEAIRFASRWNLLGVVAAAEPLVACPRLVRVVKESGLVCVSYGTLNNEPANVKLQVNEGIDAVIVDSVLAIRKGLTHPEPVESESVPNSSRENGHSVDPTAAASDYSINGVSVGAYQYSAVV